MSSRTLLIGGIVAGILAGVVLLGLALTLVALDGAALSPSAMALLILGAAAGWLLDATWLSLAIVRLATLGHGGDEGEGGDGWGETGPHPESPRPPGGDPEWWPEFEDEFREWSAGGGVDHHRAPVVAVEVVVDAGKGLKPPADVVVQM